MPRKSWAGGAAARPKQLKSWSYSTWGTWKKCPKKIFFSKIEKRPDPMGAAAQRGIRIHEMAEKFIKGSLSELPVKGVGKELKYFEKDLVRLRESPTAKAELDFTFTRNWTQTNWRDWDNAWVRMKIDAFDRHTPDAITVIDFKSGQRRDYEPQLELYGLGGFKAFPDVKEVVGEIWYIDESKYERGDEIESIVFKKEEEPALQKLWEDRVKPMMADTEFPARPSSDCSWCVFSKHRQGPCTAG